MANFRQMDNSAKRLLLIPESMEKSFRVFALPGLHSDLPCFVACCVEEQVSTLYLLSKSFCKDESWFISNSVKSGKYPQESAVHIRTDQPAMGDLASVFCVFLCAI